MNKPTHYTGRPVILRTPRNESIEFVVKANEKTVVGEINNNMDKLFEVPRVLVKLTALADGVVVDPQPTVLDRLIKFGLNDLSLNERVAATQREDVKRTSGLPLRHVADTTYEWVPESTVVLWRSSALQFEITPRESFIIAWRGERRNIDAIRVEITLDGDNCHLGEPRGVENPLG